MRPLLVRAHKPRVPRHVGGEDGGEAADRGHLSRGGRFGLTNCNAKTAPTLASRWPEDVQTSGAARHISARRSTRRLHVAPAREISPAVLSGGATASSSRARALPIRGP